MKKKYWTLAFLVSLCCLWLANSILHPALRIPPQLTFQDIQGNSWSLAELRGKPVLITFWASTCSACIREIPDLIRLHQDLSPAGFQIIAVAMAYDPPNRVVETARNWKMPYPVVLDLNWNLAETFGKIEQIPANFLLGPKGSIALRRIGQIDPQRVRTLVLNMLN